MSSSRGQKVSLFIKKREWLIPLVLGLAFVVITLPGIGWGLPDGWNPDELIQRVMKALHDEWVFDESNFDYPSLPKYAMFWLGHGVLGLGYGDAEVMWAARALSVVIGAGVVALTYALARRAGASIAGASLAAGLVLSSSEMAQQARYAHNDIYLTLFAVLVVWASLRFAQEERRGWFYLSCFFAGLAASSKYNGGALLLLPMMLYMLGRGKQLWREALPSAERLVLGTLAAGAGYALGTPRALLWMAFYFKRVIPALQAHASYGFQPGRNRGLVGQFGVLPKVFGEGLLLFGLAALIFLLVRGWKSYQHAGIKAAIPGLVVPLAVVAYDLPIMFSYNYPERFFLPLVPLFAVIMAQAVEAAWDWLRERARPAARRGLAAGLVLLFGYSFLRLASVALLFQNDARIAAGDFLSALPHNGSVEYTLYPPHIDRSQFGRAHNFPIYFIKVPGDAVPEGKIYAFNTGATGIEERGTQYLVIDSFTARRFEDATTCELDPADCAFFHDLEAGEAGYELIASFSYELPDWLPEVRISFVNPEIMIYKREMTE